LTSLSTTCKNQLAAPSRVTIPKAEESFKTVSSTRSLDAAIGNRTKLKADWESTTKKVAEQEALAATYKATAKKNEALGVIEEARGQAEANRLKAESLRVPGAREVAELEKFRLWAQNGEKVPTTLIVGGAGGFWLSKMLGIR
jgi:hypothetical protein